MAALLNSGHTEGEILAVLHGIYRDAAGGLLRDVYARGVAAWQAAEYGQALGPGDTIPRADVPVNRTLPPGTAYRYQVNVSLCAPDGSSLGVRPVEIDAGRNLTVGQVATQAESLATLLYLTFSRSRRDTDVPRGSVVCGTDLVSVERRTP